ncbi:hypothetical protein QO004_003506 [Rhizobium mesoamericanum]|uniref:hypothetical protein n=1 Tax=Rhizobium mesoamericanum TaxID=1079800 RepID=UPI002781EB7A|nr:hypothetical protein [Rhizobium mesoamericanum]MDQ0561706.1 hypothetical protein [Rhizobium mesoamericanum]
MSDLLESAISAHGGAERWNGLNQLKAHANIGGVMWHVKGWPGAYLDTHTMVTTKEPHTEFTPFLKAGQHSVWEPNETSVVADNGDVVSRVSALRSSFDGHTLMTQWNEHQLVYFSGYAMWTYLTTPFLLRLPGFESSEIEPWEEGGETWRRLKVTFPASVPSHSTEQTFYFGADGLLRRHDYSVEIMGGTASANYASDYQTINGIVFPMKRRVYSTRADNRPNLDRVAVSIDIISIEAA